MFFSGKNRKLEQEIQALKRYKTYFPPGHFHSPIPDPAYVAKHRDRIFPKKMPESIPGIDLRTDAQRLLLASWRAFDCASVIADIHAEKLRYSLRNQSSFNLCDALTLHCMLRSFKPKRLVEIGSGLSSCMTLDTRERNLNVELECTFIDPSFHAFRQRLRSGDAERHTFIENEVQEVPDAVFSALQAGDVLFVDSTHVMKTGSDVHDVFFRILRLLRAGVLIHFHDIFYPFEYPEPWVMQGWAWNELYALRALLQDSRSYDIVFFTSYLSRIFPEDMKAVFGDQYAGGSFWMRKC